MKQLMIFLTGVTSIFLSQSGNAEMVRFACLFGLCGQPFWIHETVTRKQYGMLALTLAYTGAWSIGFYNFWVK
jgi:hypothetical protein